MNEALETVRKYKKASKLMRLTFRANGPKCYKRGQGVLVIALYDLGGTATRDQLVEKLCASRKAVKDLVKKAERNGYVTIADAEEGYTATLTELGQEVAAKRTAKQEAVAKGVLAALSEEEIAQLNAINDKIIVSLKEKGIHAKSKAYKHGRKHGRKCCKH